MENTENIIETTEQVAEAVATEAAKNPDTKFWKGAGAGAVLVLAGYGAVKAALWLTKKIKSRRAAAKEAASEAEIVIDQTEE
jgi:nucleoside phosphorylase